MLQNERNDLVYLLNIVEYIGKIWQWTNEAKSIDDLFGMNEQLNLNASLNLLINIGENVAKISDVTKGKYPFVEWQYIKDFRNKIVHDYIGINIEIAFDIIKYDLKNLKQNIEKIIRKNLLEGIFVMEEINICKTSNYYKHIEFELLIQKF